MGATAGDGRVLEENKTCCAWASPLGRLQISSMNLCGAPAVAFAYSHLNSRSQLQTQEKVLLGTGALPILS